MPVRLVKENGDVISLDATSVDITVERIQSNFALPLADAKRMGIDLNQASVTVEISGVMADDVGQEQTAQAVAIMDFFQPQQIVTWGQPVNGGSGGTSSGSISSGFNMGGSTGGFTGGTGIGSNFGGGYSGGIGSSLGGNTYSPSDLGNRILRYWNEKYIDFPVGYWIEESASLTNPISSGLQLWLKADTLSATLSHGDTVATWTGSSNSRSATQPTGANQPIYYEDGDVSYIRFNGTDDFMTVDYTPFVNSEEFTLIAVVKTFASTGNDPVVSTASGSTGGGDAHGYELVCDASNTRATAKWREGATIGTDSTATSTVVNTARTMIAYTMDDTDANAQADTVIVYTDGLANTAVTSGVDYVPNTTAAMNIGTDGTDYFQGDMYEILFYNRVLTIEEREKVEGYLSRKYNIGIDDEGHRYHTQDFNDEKRHIRVAFDKQMVGSVSEPHGFLNTSRNTGLPITLISGTTITVGGNPQLWFEVAESERNYTVEFYSATGQKRTTTTGAEYYGVVTAVTSTQITVDFSVLSSLTTHAVTDFVYIRPVQYRDESLIGDNVIIIPIQNADTFDENADPEKAVGPEFPSHENGDARDNGGGLTRTDEYITYLLSKALTSTAIDTGRDVNTLGQSTMDKVFSTSISESYSGHNSRLTITQLYPSSLGLLSDTINTNLGVGQMPVTQGFSGGRSGKRVKSGGDKVQDLLGILANSNNFYTNPNSNAVTGLLQLGLDAIQQTVYNEVQSGDYIRGIQIPYNSLATKGKNVLDDIVAQRNFFVTTAGNTNDKMSDINDVHASRLFSHEAEGHQKNGISGLITDFTVHREAEMKAYDFSLLFVAADIIL
ncbi:MAG: hypothetical protein VW270_00585 [Candidatus Poseidoniales archaeon]